MIGAEAAGRVLGVVEAKVIEGAPDLHARPAELLTVLLEHTHQDHDRRSVEDRWLRCAGPQGPSHETPQHGTPVAHRALALPADVPGALRGLDLTRLVRKCVLYVHLAETAPHQRQAEVSGSRAWARSPWRHSQSR